MDDMVTIPAVELAALQIELAELRTKVERYELLLDNASDTLGLGTPTEELIYVNQAVTRMGGYTPEEYVRHSMYEFIHPDDLPRILAETEAARETMPDVTRITGRLRHKDGHYIWAEGRTRIIHDEHGGIKYLVYCSRDITDRIELEQALRQRTEELGHANAELARAARLKDEFLAGMSHELRTPLTAILGLAEALQLGIGDGALSDGQLEMIATLEDSGRHLLSLINDVLDLSKIQAGCLALDSEPTEIAACCESATRIMREMARDKRLRLHVEVAPELGWVQADPRRVKQMLVNLLSNAVKFTPAGGEIGLTATGDAAAGVLRLTVWDTGIGIAPADQAALFQPFVQVDARLAREYTGTGLGLSLVKQLAELHGGRVAVESAPGQGSRFTLTLPWVACAAPDDEHVVAPPVAAAPAGAPLVLIAEDNAVLSALFSQFLAERGYRVATAANGSEALDRAQALHPDAILMDVQMPGLDGLDVTHRLRAVPAFADLPIIAVTALAMPGDRDRCLAAGMTDYLSKPISLEQVAQALARVLPVGVAG